MLGMFKSVTRLKDELFKLVYSVYSEKVLFTCTKFELNLMPKSRVLCVKGKEMIRFPKATHVLRKNFEPLRTRISSKLQ